MQEITVPVGSSAKKLENFLKKQFPIGYIRKLFRKNGVRLNGRRAKADEPIHDGDRIQLYIPFAAQSTKPADKSSLPEIEIIDESETLLVLNKPAGITVHEGKTVLKRDTIEGVMERKYQASKFRPRLVHRLDQDTSGLLLLAKSEGALAELEHQFETGATEKDYLCLVAGRLQPNDGKIEFPLPGRDGTPVRALTRFRVVKHFHETTLVRVSIETGRLHQIRLHFAQLGYPVVMDEQHGDFDFNKRFRKRYGLKRQFLHAAKLTINYRGKRYSWSAPLAQDLEKTLKRIENEIK
jgi:23S rRNA pseudouridine955/2504/2580 synthase